MHADEPLSFWYCPTPHPEHIPAFAASGGAEAHSEHPWQDCIAHRSGHVYSVVMPHQDVQDTCQKAKHGESARRLEGSQRTVRSKSRTVSVDAEKVPASHSV